MLDFFSQHVCCGYNTGSPLGDAARYKASTRINVSVSSPTLGLSPKAPSQGRGLSPPFHTRRDDSEFGVNHGYLSLGLMIRNHPSVAKSTNYPLSPKPQVCVCVCSTARSVCALLCVCVCPRQSLRRSRRA